MMTDRMLVAVPIFLAAAAFLAPRPALSQVDLSVTTAKLERILDQTVDGSSVFGAVLHVTTGDGRLAWSGRPWKREGESQYFIASTTKLYITATVLKLRAEGRLDLDDPISRYLPASVVSGLHVHKGADHSSRLTVRHLLAHTSGLPDYFQDKDAHGVHLEAELLKGRDRRWSFEEVVERTEGDASEIRARSARKCPLLGHQLPATGPDRRRGHRQADRGGSRRIRLPSARVEADVPVRGCRRFAAATAVLQEGAARRPRAMTSFGPDGGIVSTADESMIFLRAFFGGTLFPKEYLPELYAWNRIFFPLQSGVGVIRFKLPRLFSPFRATPDLVGHSGLSGAFAFYLPEKDLYMTGTVNQIANPRAAFMTMLQIANTVEIPRKPDTR